MNLEHISATESAERTEMKRCREAAAQHLADQEDGCVMRVILSVLLRVIPRQIRLSV